jgi:hypothetical protein
MVIGPGGCFRAIKLSLITGCFKNLDLNLIRFIMFILWLLIAKDKIEKTQVEKNKKTYYGIWIACFFDGYNP